MQSEILEFITKIAWPFVGLVAILVLGPGGVLKEIIGELANNLFRITDVVESFKKIASDFHKTQTELTTSTQLIGELREELDKLTVEMKNIIESMQVFTIS